MNATEQNRDEYEDEWAPIYERRKVAFKATDVTEECPIERPKDLVGLALSGGGLRSALFNDGLLQAFSHRGLLRYVDYLCSVSGGGYIAGHLMTYANAQTGANQSQDPRRSTETSQANAGDEPKSPSPSGDFHNNPENWHFGRDPFNGREAPDRLVGIGAYLNRSSQFFAGYCLRQIPVIALYLSFTGLVATFLALYFRSFDAPLFRSVYFAGLGVRFGHELFIAFLPPLMATVLMLAIALLGWLPLSSHPKPPRLQRWLRAITKFTFWLVLFLLASSLAVYLGNDLTKATSDRNVANHNRLNQFALQMTIVAGAVQLLVFLGRDRLFRSEKSEASHWKKLLQAIIANGVVVFVIFTMVHVMARENISGYTTDRDPYLVLGDVGDWRVLEDLFQKYETAHPRPPTDNSSPNTNTAEDRHARVMERLDFKAWSARRITGDSLMHRELKYVYDAERSANPASPSEMRDQARSNSLLSPTARYYYLIRACTFGRLSKAFDVVKTHSPSYRCLWDTAEQFQSNQVQYLNDHNAILDSRDFTVLLLNELTAPIKSTKYAPILSLHWPVGNIFEAFRLTHPIRNTAATDAATGSESWKRLLETPHIRPHIDRLTATRRSSLEARLKSYDLKLLQSNEPILAKNTNAHPWPTWSADPKCIRLSLNQATLNRDLLELITIVDDHSAVRARDIAATWVVQPHDQAARWRWAFFWSIQLFVSLVLTSNLNRAGYIFEFYHDAIRKTFLSDRRLERAPSANAPGFDAVTGDTPVGHLNPESCGLPFPIFLATWLKSSSQQAVGIIPVPVAVTQQGVRVREAHLPLYRWAVGRPDGDFETSMGKPQKELQPGVPGSGNRVGHENAAAPITLASAVAASGAAVSPLMTNTTALALLMDFFGARLGFWWKNPARRQGRPLRVQATSFIWILIFVTFVVLILLALPTSRPWLTTTAFHVGQAAKAFSDVHSSKYMNLTLIAVAAVGCLAGFLVTKERGYPTLALSKLMTWRQRHTADRVDSFCAAEAAITSCWPNIFISDGGFCDYLGVTELLRRRCELIIVSDAGINTGSTTLEALALMCERASSTLGMQFVDLDHDAPIEFARLHRNERQLAPQPFIAMRVKYPLAGQQDELPEGTRPREGLLFYVQMAITERDPIEIQQIRHRFPSFPDEPTTNQFYTVDQVAAYRDLGYHIGKRLCFHLQRWDAMQIKAAHESQVPTVRQGTRLRTQPLLSEIKRRLKRAYIQTCFEEHYYSEDDVYSESIWRDHHSESVFPAFQDAARNCFGSPKAIVIEDWLNGFTNNADVFSRYVKAVTYDINCLEFRESNDISKCAEIFCEIVGVTQRREGDLVPAGRPTIPLQLGGYPDEIYQDLWAAHLAVVAAAAQQLHRGTPHAVFQVGGREKLCSLMRHLANDIAKLRKPGPGEAGMSWESYAKAAAGAMVHEVCELAECVFQDAERLAAVSFAQCFCKELVSLNPRRPAYSADNLNGATPRTDKSSLALDFRQLCLKKIQIGYRSHAARAIANYICHLYRIDI